MVSIVSMAGEELLTLELKDFDVAEQLKMEVSAEMAMCQRGERWENNRQGKKKGKKGKNVMVD